MANGLKGKFISYTNGTGSTVTIVVSGATKFQLSADAGYNIWTASMEAEGAINGQGSYKQAMAADQVLSADSQTRQANSDFLEDLTLEIANGSVLTGWIFGQNATWSLL